MTELVRRLVRPVLVFTLVAAAVAVSTAPAGATSLVRMGLDDLASSSQSVVMGRVVDLHSRWNDTGTFILTDVRLAVDDALKGAFGDYVTFTVMGGTVGDKTIMIVGGADLDFGSSYVVFLSRADLPGAPQALTVRDHCQGTFDIVESADGIRAVSQATRHPLLTDFRGLSAAPGGVLGLEYNELVRQVRTPQIGSVQ